MFQSRVKGFSKGLCGVVEITTHLAIKVYQMVLLVLGGALKKKGWTDPCSNGPWNMKIPWESPCKWLISWISMEQVAYLSHETSWNFMKPSFCRMLLGSLNQYRILELHHACSVQPQNSKLSMSATRCNERLKELGILIPLESSEFDLQGSSPVNLGYQ